MINGGIEKVVEQLIVALGQTTAALESLDQRVKYLESRAKELAEQNAMNAKLAADMSEVISSIPRSRFRWSK